MNESIDYLRQAGSCPSQNPFRQTLFPAERGSRTNPFRQLYMATDPGWYKSPFTNKGQSIDSKSILGFNLSLSFIAFIEF